jgi:hypothetical protein
MIIATLWRSQICGHSDIICWTLTCNDLDLHLRIFEFTGTRLPQLNFTMQSPRASFLLLPLDYLSMHHVTVPHWVSIGREPTETPAPRDLSSQSLFTECGPALGSFWGNVKYWNSWHFGILTSEFPWIVTSSKEATFHNASKRYCWTGAIRMPSCWDAHPLQRCMGIFIDSFIMLNPVVAVTQEMIGMVLLAT